MSNTQTNAGAVAALYRYPVKSMLGEKLKSSEITSNGLLGDRMYALVDNADGKVGSAKNPRKWPTLFGCHAAFTATPHTGAEMPPVQITLPDGAIVSNEQSDINQILSNSLQRQVTLTSILNYSKATGTNAEGLWPDMEGVQQRDVVSDFTLHEGTFFDGAVILILTTATLGRLSELYPQGRFDARRFRPNIVVQPDTGQTGFTENEWVGHTLVIGNKVRLNITRPCTRCIMTTLPLEDLPADFGILRTVAKHNKANVGVYAKVIQGGTVSCNDSVWIE